MLMERVMLINLITQTGNNKNYNANLWCGHSYCTMTLNQ